MAHATLSDGSKVLIRSMIRYRAPRLPAPTLPEVRKPVVYDVPDNADLLTRGELIEHDRVIDPQTNLQWRVVSEDGRLVLAPIDGGDFRMEIEGAWASLAIFLIRPDSE